MEIKLKGHILHIGETAINVPFSLGANDLSKEEGKAICDLINEKDKRIAELERLNDWLVDIQITAAKLDNEQRKSIAELEDKLQMASLLCKPESLRTHNLEQQVKSLSEFAESLLFRGCLENTFERHDVLERIKEIKGGDV
jgi:hypothetical protein